MNESGLEGMPEWTPTLTPFSSLMAKQTSSSATIQAESKHNQLGLAGKKELEEVSNPSYFSIFIFKQFIQANIM